MEQLKHAHGRYSIEVDISSADYSALTDGKDRPIPFTVNLTGALTLSVKLVDSLAFADLYFNVGDNPNLVIAIEADGTVSSGVVSVVYPYKPASTTIKTEY